MPKNTANWDCVLTECVVVVLWWIGQWRNWFLCFLAWKECICKLISACEFHFLKIYCLPLKRLVCLTQVVLRCNLWWHLLWMRNDWWVTGVVSVGLKQAVSDVCCGQADVNLAGYKKHIQSQSAPKPLTFAEEELEEIKRKEVQLWYCFIWTIIVRGSSHKYDTK